MFIDGKQILSNPGLHGPLEKCVTVEVTKVEQSFLCTGCFNKK